MKAYMHLFINLFMSFFRKFAQTIPRSFSVRLNPYTQSIEVLDSKLQVENLIRDLNQETKTLLSVFKKL